MNKYSEKFYKKQKDGSIKSAEEIIPLLLDLIPVRSVLDVGCGVGTWLSVFYKKGVERILGVDGDYVDRKSLFIPEEKFIPSDLPYYPDDIGYFDLVISLEVAEHLSPESANVFIKLLTSKAPIVLFSAAIPGQGGVGHINEQWPEYWIEKFRENNYIHIDCLRHRIWSNKNVKWWYAQNLFIFVDADKLDHYPKLKSEMIRNSNILSMVHPDKYLQSLNNFSFRNFFKRFFRKIW